MVAPDRTPAPRELLCPTLVPRGAPGPQARERVGTWAVPGPPRLGVDSLPGSGQRVAPRPAPRPPRPAPAQYTL